MTAQVINLAAVRRARAAAALIARDEAFVFPSAERPAIAVGDRVVSHSGLVAGRVIALCDHPADRRPMLWLEVPEGRHLRHRMFDAANFTRAEEALS